MFVLMLETVVITVTIHIISVMMIEFNSNSLELNFLMLRFYFGKQGHQVLYILLKF